jgi:single-strand DNA-binding protein
VQPGGRDAARSGSPSATCAGAAELRRISMFNPALLIVTGNVVSDPVYEMVGNNIPKLTLRVAWDTRKLDQATGEWSDANTSYARVTCWRKLAENLNVCLHKGDSIFLRGKLEVRNFIGRDGQRKTAVEVEAITLGPDLTRGVARFQRFRSDKTAQREGELGEGENGDQYGTGALAGLDGDLGDQAAALAGVTDGEADAPADDMFDDSAIAALAKDADSVAAPF